METLAYPELGNGYNLQMFQRDYAPSYFFNEQCMDPMPFGYPEALPWRNGYVEQPMAQHCFPRSSSPYHQRVGKPFQGKRPPSESSLSCRSSEGPSTPKDSMAEDPGHKVMLYFLETLMYSNQPMTISQLAGRFGGRCFTQEMRQAAGGNETGLEKFLLKYPSLFKVNGNMVSLNDGTAPQGGDSFRENSPGSSSSTSHPDVSVETEAVQYFRDKILKKGEAWMPIKSLAGHLSQANVAIRECVGPQNEFNEWLLKHPLIFVVDGDMVGLRDNINFSAVNPNAEPLEGVRMTGGDRVPPTQNTPRLKRRPKSLDVGDEAAVTSPRPLSTSGGKAGPITMTANEYKAVMFIKNIIEKKGDMKLSAIANNFSQAPESMRNTIGWSKGELANFITNHSNIFIVGEDEMVSTIKNTRLNVIITGSRPQQQTAAGPSPGISARKGKIFHVAKLWGIIDLGKHEHVFIDRTIFGKHIDDLNKLLKVGETVCFDAIPAQKGSRARWRATKVWKEHESIEDLVDKIAAKLDLPVDGVGKEVISRTIDDEMKDVMPELNDQATTPLNVGGVKYAFSDAAPSGAGVVPVWNFQHVELQGLKDVDDLGLSDDEEESSPRISMVAERHYMNRSVLGDSPRDIASSEVSAETSLDSESQLASGNSNNNSANSTSEMDASTSTSSTDVRKFADASCQTIVTGDVLATQLFHENI